MTHPTGNAARDDDLSPAPDHRTSFVLRCWADATNQVHARLIDVCSGVDYPVAHLADLPGLVRRLMARSAPELAEGGDALSSAQDVMRET